jgi:hypothetical protein
MDLLRANLKTMLQFILNILQKSTNRINFSRFEITFKVNFKEYYSQTFIDYRLKVFLTLNITKI